MLEALVLFPQHLVFYLGTRIGLFLHELLLATALSFLLLTLNHGLERSVFDVVLLALHVKVVFLLLLLVFDVLNIALDFLLIICFVHINVLLELVLHGSVLGLSGCFFFLLLPLALHFSLLSFNVALALGYDVLSALFGFVDLLPSLCGG